MYFHNFIQNLIHFEIILHTPTLLSMFSNKYCKVSEEISLIILRYSSRLIKCILYCRRCVITRCFIRLFKHSDAFQLLPLEFDYFSIKSSNKVQNIEYRYTEYRIQLVAGIGQSQQSTIDASPRWHSRFLISFSPSYSLHSVFWIGWAYFNISIS